MIKGGKFKFSEEYKIKNELNWKRSFDFEAGLQNTVDWYLNNKKWIENVRSGEYRNWIEKNYNER